MLQAWRRRRRLARGRLRLGPDSALQGYAGNTFHGDDKSRGSYIRSLEGRFAQLQLAFENGVDRAAIFFRSLELTSSRSQR